MNNQVSSIEDAKEAMVKVIEKRPKGFFGKGNFRISESK